MHKTRAQNIVWLCCALTLTHLNIKVMHTSTVNISKIATDGSVERLV